MLSPSTNNMNTSNRQSVESRRRMDQTQTSTKARQPQQPVSSAATARSNNRRSLLPQVRSRVGGQADDGPGLGSTTSNDRSGRNFEDEAASLPSAALTESPGPSTIPNIVASSSRLSRHGSVTSTVSANSLKRTGPQSSHSRTAPSVEIGKRTGLRDGRQRSDSRMTPSSNIGVRSHDSQTEGKPPGPSRLSSVGAHQKSASKNVLATHPTSRSHARLGGSSDGTVAFDPRKQTAASAAPAKLAAKEDGVVSKQRSRPASVSPSKFNNAANARSQMLPPPRAAFNTFQQHYSPAKSSLPKPPIPSTRPSQRQTEVEPIGIISPELIQQQIELFQLSLLHEESMETLLEFEETAFYKLSQQHLKLRERFLVLKDTEAKQRRVMNLEALQAWCPDRLLLRENLSTLCRAHEELSRFNESDSKFNRLVLEFADWIDGGDAQDVLAPLPQSWREDHVSVTLKLRSLQRLLQTLPPVAADRFSGTSLWVLSRDCNRLIDGMLQELDVLLALESTIMRTHRLGIDQQVEDYVQVRLTAVKPDGWNPAWTLVNEP